MSNGWQFVITGAAAYLAGSFPSGKIAGGLYGIDIQKKGSGNIGFANVRRTLGWKAALPVLAADILKGYLPVLLAKRYLSVHEVMAVALLAVLGHLFPVWLRFRGGKGVATTIGASLAISFPAGLIAGFIYLAGAAAFRVPFIASLSAIYSLPFLMLAFSSSYAWFFAGITIVITWAHRSNIKQMAGGRTHGSVKKP